MLLTAQILIALPLAILTLVGLAYLLAPSHFPYHRTVIEKVGEKVLALKLLELLIVCGVGVGLAEVEVMQTKPTAVIFPHALMALGVIMVALSAHGRTLVVRRCAGLMVLLFCTAEFMLLSAASSTAVLAAGAIAATLLLYVTYGTRALGVRTGAKTPWPLLVALCVTLIAGTLIAYLA